MFYTQDTICLLTEDFQTRHEDFVKNMVLCTLDQNPNTWFLVGNIFNKLLSKQILSKAAITQGYH